MKKLLKYLKDYKLESILGPLFKMLEASFELFVPLVMAKIIDIGIKNSDTGYILKMGGVLILLGVVGLTCSLTAQYFSARAAVGFGTALRNDLFKHINTFSYSEIDTVGTATLVTRMTSDANQVQNGVNMVLRLFLRSPFIVFGAMVMAFTIDVKSALIFVVAIPLLSVVVFGILIISMPLYKKVQRQLDRVLLTTRENLLGARVVRAFNRQQDECRKFDEENGLLVQFQVFVGKISALMNPVTYIIINGAIIVLIWTGSWQVENGVITQGEVVALVNYMSQILVELVKLANLIIIISKSLASANRISSVFDIPGGLAEKNRGGTVDSGSGQTKVEFQNLGFVYAGAKEESLEGISFAAEKGQTIGIIGGTGSGKSTLVNMIPRFYDATTGAVLVDGVDVKEYSFEQLRDKIGIVPQKAVLFKGTIRDNIRWGKKDATDEEIYEALRTAQAAAFVEEKNEGLDLPILQGGKNLSGGQKQRLTIARALVKRPEILILDDSASALDFATDAALRKAIRENTRDMTVFIVSQRASSIRNADRILVLDDGRLAGSGTHRELLKTCDVYREICLSQLSEEEVLRDEQA
ncbi:MAG: ABC transporter ATP-binding protein [Hungatella hathewayi]|nr:ABC transporter ATP-binding protein [Hungatella hathewayi]